MFRHLILTLAMVLTPAFFTTALDAAQTVSCIEQQLVEEIFGPRWGLNACESDLLLKKLQAAHIRNDYETLLKDLYTAAINFHPKPFEPSLWEDDTHDALTEPTHMILIENKNLRILEVIIPPGYFQAYHTHRWPGILVDLVSSDFYLYANGEEILLPATDNPVFSQLEGQPLHSAKNIGPNTYVGLHIEFKG